MPFFISFVYHSPVSRNTVLNINKTFSWLSQKFWSTCAAATSKAFHASEKINAKTKKIGSRKLGLLGSFVPFMFSATAVTAPTTLVHITFALPIAPLAPSFRRSSHLPQHLFKFSAKVYRIFQPYGAVMRIWCLFIDRNLLPYYTFGMTFNLRGD